MKHEQTLEQRGRAEKGDKSRYSTGIRRLTRSREQEQGTEKGANVICI